MIDIDESVHQSRGEHFGCFEHVHATTSGDPVLVAAALSRAGDRYMLVDETGVEHPDEDAAEEAFSNDLYTPNYVSSPSIDDNGRITMYVDCKGAMEDAMAARFREILREELAGIPFDVRVTGSATGS